jgi:hypothetical protein
MRIMAGQPSSRTRILICSEEGTRLDSFVADSAAWTPRCPVPWSIRKTTLHGGKQEGVDVVQVDSGRLRLRVSPTRGMGILDARLGDIRLGWDSPVREVVHPQFVNLQSRGGLGWLEGFHEWLVRCGLEWAGAPGVDRFVGNGGDEARMELSLHGKIANIPASRVEIEVAEEPPYTLKLRGRVDERMLFGPQLELWSEIAVVPGSAEFTVTDTVANRAAAEQEFQLLYHLNFGPPLLEKGARLVAATDRVVPSNARAAEDAAHFDLFHGPEIGFVEKVYCITPHSDSRGCTAFVLRNAAGDRGLLLDYSVDSLPCFTLWKNLGDVRDGYVVGLEPATSFPFTRRVERHFGRVPRLASGENRTFTLRFRLLEGRREVAAAEDLVEAIRAGRPPEIVGEPPIPPDPP